MSLWSIERVGPRLKLTFTHEPLAADPHVQPCGECEEDLASDLEAWVIDQAEPWDLVRTARGLFVRQRTAAQDGLGQLGDAAAGAAVA